MVQIDVGRFVHDTIHNTIFRGYLNEFIPKYTEVPPHRFCRKLSARVVTVSANENYFRCNRQIIIQLSPLTRKIKERKREGRKEGRNEGGKEERKE